MKVNYIIENSRGLKYLGCATIAQQLLDILQKKDIDIQVNSREDGFDLVHAHTFGPLALTQKRKAKSIITAHSTPSVNKGNIITGGFRFWRSIYRRIYNSFDHVFAVSKNSVKELNTIGIVKPIFILENGVNTDYFNHNEQKGNDFRKTHGFKEDDYVVLNVAQITPRKGIYEFIETARRNPDKKFLWIGGFPYFLASSDYLHLKNEVQKAPENLQFTGFVEDIIGAYSGANLLFTPSFNETFGLTILEASACDLPVLARDLDVFHELFDNEIHYASSIDGFSEVIQSELMKSENTLAKRYNLDSIAEKLIQQYEEIITT